MTGSFCYDQFMAALCLWREARNCDKDAMAGVYWVLINRARDSKKRWPSSVHGCVLQPKQFSSFNPGDPNSSKFPNSNDNLEWAKFQDCLTVVGGVDPILDPTKGANHYENCAAGQLPLWADPAKITVQIGPFRFYKL